MFVNLFVLKEKYTNILSLCNDLKKKTGFQDIGFADLKQINLIFRARAGIYYEKQKDGSLIMKSLKRKRKKKTRFW